MFRLTFPEILRMTALVIGATGLVGYQLVLQLLEDQRFTRVDVFARRSCGLKHDKLREHLISFERTEQWSGLVRGDVLFSALGTTLKQAGGKEAQYKIDFTYQYQFAAAAAKNGVPHYVLISSAGADAHSRIFYSRMKGELENAVRLLPFQKISLLQPGLLTGKRSEERFGEKVGFGVLNLLHRLPGLGAWKPVPGAVVAKAMIRALTEQKEPFRVYKLGEVFRLAGVS